jgi:hypothetical protein
MKKLSLFLLFLSLLLIPVALWLARQGDRVRLEENSRYDINDYLADEGL